MTAAGSTYCWIRLRSPHPTKVTRGSIGLACVLPVKNLELARWLAVAILLLVASGWRRVTGVLHWWVSFSLHANTLVLWSMLAGRARRGQRRLLGLAEDGAVREPSAKLGPRQKKIRRHQLGCSTRRGGGAGTIGMFRHCDPSVSSISSAGGGGLPSASAAVGGPIIREKSDSGPRS